MSNTCWIFIHQISIIILSIRAYLDEFWFSSLLLMLFVRQRIKSKKKSYLKNWYNSHIQLRVRKFRNLYRYSLNGNFHDEIDSFHIWYSSIVITVCLSVHGEWINQPFALSFQYKRKPQRNAKKVKSPAVLWASIYSPILHFSIS